MAITRTGLNLASQGYTPVIYSKKLVAKFYAESVCNSICNANWQGEITQQGQSVILRQRPNVDVTPTTVNAKINWQDLDAATITLSIDYAFDAAIKIDSIDAHQMDINLRPEVVDEIANKLRLKIETTVLGSAYSGLSNTLAYNKYTSWNTSGSPQKYLADVMATLDVHDVPNEGRWICLHPNMIPAIMNETALFALNAGTPQGALQAGFVGETLAGLRIYKSRFIPGAGTTAAPYQCIAGHTETITLATQFTQFEILAQLQDYYGSGIRAQNCFGYKVVKPETGVVLQGYIS